jgi:hypothetical protein
MAIDLRSRVLEARLARLEVTLAMTAVLCCGLMRSVREVKLHCAWRNVARAKAAWRDARWKKW